MEQVIWFRTLVDTFSNIEFDIFINKLYNTFDKRSIIISSLFHLLLNEFKQNESSYIKNVNKIILDIIHSRNSKLKSITLNPIKLESVNNDKIAPISINDIPSALLSECASYLLHNEVLNNFQICNRYLYLYICKNFKIL